MQTRFLLAALVLFSAATVATAQTADSSFLLNDRVGPVTGTGGSQSCVDVDTYAQPLDAANFNTARTSDEQPAQQAWEDIVDGGGAIVPFTGGDTTTLRVWGLSIEFNNGFVATCLEDHTALTAYNVSFYADNAGAPAAAPSFTTTATPTAITDTAIPFAFTSIFEYDLTLDTPAPEGYEWISIVRQTGVQTQNGTDCYWLWVDETLVGSYDDSAFSLANGAEPTDQVMCIGAAAFEPATPIIEVPTVSNAGILALIALLAGCGFFAIRRFS